MHEKTLIQCFAIALFLESHFVQVRGHKEGGPRSKAETRLCIDALEVTFHKGHEWSEYMCYYHGTGKLNDKDKKLFLINHLMLGRISNHTIHSNSTIYASNATLPHLQYVLFLEDDAFISLTALQQIAEVFLQGTLIHGDAQQCLPLLHFL